MYIHTQRLIVYFILSGNCLGTFYPGSKVSCCNISSDGASVVVGLAGIDNIIILTPPGKPNANGNISVFGDSARNGAVFDVSKHNTS